MKKVVVSCAILAFGSAAMAQSWVEGPGDAGAFPAVSGFQDTVGVGALTSISGNTDTAGGDLVDAYRIRITDPALFVATTDESLRTLAIADFDTRLWLFDMAGNVVMANDDLGGAPFRSWISDPALFTNGTGTVSATMPPTALAVGEYVLVISGFNNDPEDALGVDLADISSQFNALVGPDPAAGAFAAWETGTPGSGLYTIALEGVAYAIVPAPGALALIGLGGLVATRRRR